MKHPTSLQRTLSFVAALFMAAGISHAQLLLSVDFNAGSTTPSPTQAGFQGFSVGVGAYTTDLSVTYSSLSTSLSSGSVTVTLGVGTGANFTARDRSTMAGSGSFADYDLYRDWTSARTLSLSGLNANTQYTVVFYSYDNSTTATTTYTDFTSGSAGSSTSITSTAGYAFTSSTPNSIFASSLTVTSNASGTLAFNISGSNVFTNGFQIYAVPEASTSALLLGGMAAFFLIVKRRRKSPGA